MPELPEVETVRQALAHRLAGADVSRAALGRADILTRPERTPAARALLAGDRIIELKRHGKQLALCAASGRTLVVHLGMTGQLLLAPAHGRTTLDHIHARWTWSKGDRTGRLLFRDPRRFGGLTAFPSRDALEAVWAHLGPDAATVTHPELSAAFQGTRGPRRAPIKALLLNQQLIAGIGNIYADEALHAARITPHRSAGSLDDREIRTLARNIREVLRQAIAAGGSTIRDYADANGSAGWFQSRHKVYGRGGKPCRRCKTPLTTALIAQRTTVWCERCQPG